MLNLDPQTNELRVVRRIPVATVAAGELFERSAFALVTAAAVSVLEAGASPSEAFGNPGPH